MERAKATADKIKMIKAVEKVKHKGEKKKVTIAPPRKEVELPGNMAVVGFTIRVGKGRDTKKKFDQKRGNGNFYIHLSC